MSRRKRIQAHLFFIQLMHGYDIVIDPSDFRTQRFRGDLQLWNNIDKRADTAFKLQELIQHDDFSLLQNTIAALEVTSFIADDVFSLI